jgi:hypothetical protein
MRGPVPHPGFARFSAMDRYVPGFERKLNRKGAADLLIDYGLPRSQGLVLREQTCAIGAAEAFVEIAG